MKLKIVSSSKKIYESSDIQELYAPSTSGQIGILKGHANLITSLDIGVLKIKENDKIGRIFINGGVMQVHSNNILILADEAELAENVVQMEIEEAIKLAESQISEGKIPPSELIQLEKKLRYERFKQNSLG